MGTGLLACNAAVPFCGAFLRAARRLGRQLDLSTPNQGLVSGDSEGGLLPLRIVAERTIEILQVHLRISLGLVCGVAAGGAIEIAETA